MATALRAAEPDLVVNLAEAFDGKSALESNVAALLNLLDLRYTGSSPAGLMLAGDKALSKKVLSFHGVRSPQFATVHRGDVEWAGDLAFPLIVKPPQEDASIGITHASVVHNVQGLLEQMGEVQGRFHQPPLVEQFIDGREFYVGVIGNADARALPPLEMDFTGFPTDRPRIASWAAKWGDDGEEKGAEYAGTRTIEPKDLSPELDEKLRATALDAFHALRLRDYARVDMRATEVGRGVRHRGQSQLLPRGVRRVRSSRGDRRHELRRTHCQADRAGFGALRAVRTSILGTASCARQVTPR